MTDPKNDEPYVDPLPALETEIQRRYAAISEQGLASVSAAELHEVMSLVRQVENLKSMRESLRMVGENLLPAVLPGIVRWANGAVDLRENVRLFHEVVIGGELPERPGVPEEAVARRRLRLIAEEFIEVMGTVFDARLFDMVHRDLLRIIESEPLEIAEDSSRLPQFAQELADLEYVCEGAFLGFGIDSRPVHTAVQEANMRKNGGPVRADGKRMKPIGWVGPDVASIIKKQKNAAEIKAPAPGGHGVLLEHPAMVLAREAMVREREVMEACDVCGATALKCICDRCERERAAGDESECYHACQAHLAEVNVSHERVRGRAAVWGNQ